MDFARRAHDHNYRLDPIVRSLLDTDFYKMSTLQFVFFNFRFATVDWFLKNRTKKVKLGSALDIEELRAQLDHVRTLRFTQDEIIWLRGQTFYGQTGIFRPAFIDFLQHGFKLSAYELAVVDGEIELTFSGPWVETTMWEIYALAIINELRYRKIMSKMSKSQLDIMFARAKVKLYDKLKRISGLKGLNLSEFGTRRRFSFLWQEHAILTAREVLGPAFSGTSNCYLAKKHGLEAKGTIPHEITMAIAAMSKNDEELKSAQYRALRLWQDDYREGMLVALPDTFGSTQFFRDAPDFLQFWQGFRPDSKKNLPSSFAEGVLTPENEKVLLGGEEVIAFYESRLIDPKTKLNIFSDGLDVALPGFECQGEDIVELHERYADRIRTGYGFGTMMTADFIGCHPEEDFRPLSIVCKVKTADSNPAVKLSDSKSKALGDPQEVVRYQKLFGDKGMIEGRTPNV